MQFENRLFIHKKLDFSSLEAGNWVRKKRWNFPQLQMPKIETNIHHSNGYLMQVDDNITVIVGSCFMVVL